MRVSIIPYRLRSGNSFEKIFATPRVCLCPATHPVCLFQGDSLGFDDGRALWHDGPHWNQAECRACGHLDRFRRHWCGVHRSCCSGMGDVFSESCSLERQPVSSSSF